MHHHPIGDQLPKLKQWSGSALDRTTAQWSPDVTYARPEQQTWTTRQLEALWSEIRTIPAENPDRKVIVYYLHLMLRRLLRTSHQLVRRSAFSFNRPPVRNPLARCQTMIALCCRRLPRRWMRAHVGSRCRFVPTVALDATSIRLTWDSNPNMTAVH